MKLQEIIPADVLKRIPPLYSQSEVSDPLVHAEIRVVGLSWTWYVVECDGENQCFGLVDGWEAELGYFNLSELSEAPGALISFGMYRTPVPLSRVQADVAQRRSG
jgi:hypothetical protein